MNKEAHKILIDYYGDDINEARLKMAYIPLGAKLLNNPVSSAPGFAMKNVIVMAGVPKIMQEMFKVAKKDLSSGDKIISQEIKVITSESKIAKELSDLQNKYEEVVIGSYPSKTYICIVFRCYDNNILNFCLKEFISILENKKINYDL
jgi:molybdopterin-biosynthesis enzyme MoeA-like protein